MSRRFRPWLFLTAPLLGILFIGPAIAGDEVATFEAFYRDPHSISWGWPALAALLIGVVLYLGFFPVTGPITAIGTSIGGFMGLSGAAATNAGLALLGGGAVISGGLGVMGGAALLGAAISFSTDVILDYAAGNILERYEYRRFAENSWRMLTLPLPRNSSEPESVKAAGKALKTQIVQPGWECFKEKKYRGIADFKECLASKVKPQSEFVRAALAELDRYGTTEKVSPENEARKHTMYAALRFIDNDYLGARRSADTAYSVAIKASQRATLPAFIVSASMFYDRSPDFSKSFELFRYAVTAEPNNPLTPILFSVYLERLAYRLNDGAASLNDVDRVVKLAEELSEDDRKIAIQKILLSHSFMQIKIAQQRIISLTGTQNKAVREDKLTLKIIKSSLSDYRHLLTTSKVLLDRQVSLMGVRNRQQSSWWGDIAKGINPLRGTAGLDKTQGWSESIWTFSKAWVEYQRDAPALAERAAKFEIQHEVAPEKRSS